MKVTFNPNAAAHNPNARPPQSQNTSTTTAPEGSGDSVEITLSQAAQSILKNAGSGNSGSSPAHMAAAYAEAEGYDGPFGQLVKTFTPGYVAPEAVEDPDVVPEDGGDVGEVTEPTDGGEGTGEVAEGSEGTGDTGTTDGGDTTVVDGSDVTDGTTVVDGTDGTDGTDATGVVEGSEGSDGGESTVVAGDPDGTVGTDPTIVVEEPDVTEVLDESAPAEGEVTEPESGIAGSGDAVASSGDDAPVDEGSPVDSDEPVTVVDTGDLTDELLDLLDEGTEEVV